MWHKIYKKIIRRLRKYYQLYVLKEPKQLVLKAWLHERGDDTHRIDYDLTSSSLVFDVGGYKGDWTEKIDAKYHPWINIFEPVLSYFMSIERRFTGNKKVSVYNFALSNKTCEKIMAVDESSSSFYKKVGREQIKVEMRDIAEVMEKLQLRDVDLMKINIEGCEYDLLERLIEVEFVKNIKNIQVQFHDFVPDAEERMKKIQKELQKTHYLTYCYPFVWENWTLHNTAELQTSSIQTENKSVPHSGKK